MTVEIHQLPADAARTEYRAAGFQVASTMAPALRHATPQEQSAALEGEDVSDAAALIRAHRLIADGPPQLRIELDRSGLVALTVPTAVYSGHTPSAAWTALRSVTGDRVPAIESADHCSVVLLFLRPPTSDAVRRRLELDVTIDAIRPAGDQSNLLPVPHAGCLERWVTLGSSAPALPTELEVMLTADATISDADIAQWVEKHYRKARGTERGVTREDVYGALLAANGWCPSDYDVHSLSRAVQLVSFFNSKRDKHGIKWLLCRNDVPLSSLKGVSVEAIDPVELAAFRAWRASREMSRERRAERAAQAAQHKAKLEEAAILATRFGSVEVRDDLVRQDGGVNFFQLIEQSELKRQRACDAMALEFKPLDIRQSTPDWWVLSPPGTPHIERYRTLVAARNAGAL